MHGTSKTSWTMLDSTANVGDDSITVTDALDNWVIGDELVIATTDFYGSHSEKVTITAISG